MTWSASSSARARVVSTTSAAARLMKAIERVTADPSLHTPDLGGKATTKKVTDAVCEALWQTND